MSAPLRLAAFAAALAVLFAGAAVAGGAIGPERGGKKPERGHDAAASRDSHGHDAPTEEHANMTTPAAAVRGLAVADDGLRLVVDQPELPRGRTAPVRMRIVDSRGDAVRDFDVEHEKRMHMIVVRRDLTGFQHLHPRMDASGTWSAPVRLDDAGSYRVFADFSTGGKPRTLATDLRVDGNADLQALPRPVSVAKSDGGYDVRLDAGRARAGAEADLRFSITRNGQTIHTEPYLGAGGHLVALREGDLAFLHVHPTEHGAGHDDSVGFAATFPTEGRYRLFLQFKHEGRVQTVAFTQAVGR